LKKFKIKSFCKINLTLKVLKKLRNDYHSIESLVTFCNIYDVISISKIKALKDKISFSGKFKNGINKKSNTITKVLYFLRKRHFLQKQCFKINIQKNIPHGSGLGGGSSNAASLLKFINSNMRLKLNKLIMYKIANQVGFDTSLILEKKNTLITNNKNKILRLKQKFGLNILIVYPNIICSTKKIYENNRKFDFSKTKIHFNVKSKKKLIFVLKKEKNDLEETVTKLYPEVKKVINFVKIQNGCYFSRITGSGSACIGIFSSMQAAVFTQKLIKLKFPKYWCVVSKTI